VKPLERRSIIADMVKKHEIVQVTDISRVCQVSEMTIYRDIQKLQQEGRVLKTSRGITSVKTDSADENACVCCFKPAEGRLAARIVYEDGSAEKVCCAHCALLRFKEKKEKPKQIISRDFMLDTTFNARRAVFVVGSSLPVLCCSPHVLAFQRREEAAKFIKGFGGSLHTIEEAADAVENGMEDDCCFTAHFNHFGKER
jgi:DeoR family transcriptional regulator, copper-sensing transcriptional repressor